LKDPESQRVNSSKVEKGDTSLIEPIEMMLAEGA
jgi:hypothetical protein